MLPDRVEIEDANSAGVGVQQPAQNADRCRLARAVRTNQAEHLAAPHAERQVVDRERGTIAFDDAVERERVGGRHYCSASTASTGIPCFRMPAGLSTAMRTR